MGKEIGKGCSNAKRKRGCADIHGNVCCYLQPIMRGGQPAHFCRLDRRELSNREMPTKVRKESSFSPLFQRRK